MFSKECIYNFEKLMHTIDFLTHISLTFFVGHRQTASAEPEQMWQNVALDQVLHCLLIQNVLKSKIYNIYIYIHMQVELSN